MILRVWLRGTAQLGHNIIDCFKYDLTSLFTESNETEVYLFIFFFTDYGYQGRIPPEGHSGVHRPAAE